MELPACRYEVQGEYVIPSVAAIPKSAAEMALMQGAGGQGAGPGTSSPFEQADGRWRVQVIRLMHQTYQDAAPASQKVVYNQILVPILT